MAITETIVAPIWPQTADGKTVFNQKSDALAPQLIDIQDQMNTYATQANALATEVNGYQVTASAAAVAAANAQTAAEGARDDSQTILDSNTAIAAAVQSAAGLPSVSGNAGRFLQVNDTEDGVLWGENLASGVVLLTVDLSGETAVDITDLDSYGCQTFIVQFENVAVSSGDRIAFRTSTDNGVSFDSVSGDYTLINHRFLVDGTTTSELFSGTDSVSYASGGNIEVAPSLRMGQTTISGTQDSSSYTTFETNGHYITQPSEAKVIESIGAVRKATAVIDAIRITVGLSGTKTFNSGKIKLIGLN